MKEFFIMGHAKNVKESFEQFSTLYQSLKENILMEYLISQGVSEKTRQTILGESLFEKSNHSMDACVIKVFPDVDLELFPEFIKTKFPNYSVMVSDTRISTLDIEFEIVSKIRSEIISGIFSNEEKAILIPHELSPLYFEQVWCMLEQIEVDDRFEITQKPYQSKYLIQLLKK